MQMEALPSVPSILNLWVDRTLKRGMVQEGEKGEWLLFRPAMLGRGPVHGCKRLVVGVKDPGPPTARSNPEGTVPQGPLVGLRNLHGLRNPEGTLGLRLPLSALRASLARVARNPRPHGAGLPDARIASMARKTPAGQREFLENAARTGWGTSKASFWKNPSGQRGFPRSSETARHGRTRPARAVCANVPICPVPR